jgi:hypothetical protein
MTLFLMPTGYAVMNKRSDERDAKAEARRDRIAAGEGRAKHKPHSQAVAAGIAIVAETAIQETEDKE